MFVKGFETSVCNFEVAYTQAVCPQCELYFINMVNLYRPLTV